MDCLNTCAGRKLLCILTNCFLIVSKSLTLPRILYKLPSLPTLHREPEQRMRDCHSSEYIFTLKINTKLSELKAWDSCSFQYRGVKWNRIHFNTREATVCIRKIDEVICRKVQHWKCFYVCFYILHLRKHSECQGEISCARDY